ncbi:HlyD family secretion protein [Rhodopseudomonas palustris]|uniref:HlyD family secretion protein n=1 Tax=Rhodopseudomonas palustris TaxID=1076 RepID=UPI0020CE5CBD|nr:HlyD family secretion protein [Rhodopseudomonas palustris]MCP9627111.1 HlyD family secretion protein [Rhodopseudomonas palustris]
MPEVQQPAPPLPPAGEPGASTLRRLALPLLAVAIAIAFVVLATLRWDIWIGHRAVQSTDDAYIRAQTTRLSSRVAGEVKAVAVNDFQRVKAGDLLLQIDPADYEAQLAQAEAGVVGAQAALDNLANQIELQYATIAQAEAQRVSAEAQEVEAGQELARQKTLSQSEAGTRQRLEQAIAAQAKAQADVKASRAVIAAQTHQLEVLNGTKKQRAADLAGAKATRDAAALKLSYTRIAAPFDGVVSERQVQPGDYVNIGTYLISVVPLPDVYVVANFKETQLTRVKPGQPVEIVVDTFSGEKLHGRVERISPASGAQFALLPPDNATGNFTKVVQRIPVRIRFDKDQPLLSRLLPGMSVTARIDTSAAPAP